MAREVRCHQTDRRKDGRTDGLTHRPTTVTLAAHARRGLISFYIGEICVCVCVCVCMCALAVIIYILLCCIHRVTFHSPS